MPYVAGVLIFSWEICALYNSGGFWGHVVWLALDVMTVCLGFLYAGSKKKRMIYAASIITCTAVLMFVFKTSAGMLYSVFAIDLIMAIWFLVDRKTLSSKLKVPIAVTKLLGDMCAGFYYSEQSTLAGVIAVIVFVCNMYYLYLCLEERDASQKATA